MTPEECTDGRPRRRRARDGRGGGRGASQGRGDGRGRGTSVARGAAASVAAFVAKDVLDPDGLVRPMLRGAAERLQNSPSRLLCRTGARYLALDPHPVEVIEPVTAAPQGGPPAVDRASLPAYAGEAAESDAATDTGGAADDEAEIDAKAGVDADAATDAGATADAQAEADTEAAAGADAAAEADVVRDAESGTPTAEGREAPPA